MELRTTTAGKCVTILTCRRSASAGPKCMILRRCCCCLTLGVVVFLVIGIIMSVVRRHNRLSMLNPLLNALENSPACSIDLNHFRHTCSLNLGTAGDKFQLHPAENPLFGFLYSQLLGKDPDLLKEVLFGAYVLFPDPKKEFYAFLTTLPHAHKRISSHKSSSLQYGIPEGTYLSAILIGTIPCPASAGAGADAQCTWLQFEGSEWHPFVDPIGGIGHSLDYFHHKICGCNIGPLGTSTYTDASPLVISGAVPNRSVACPSRCPDIGASFYQKHRRDHFVSRARSSELNHV